MKSFEDEFKELMAYVPFLEGLLETFSQDPSKQSVKIKIELLLDLVKNKKLKPCAVDKCKAILEKVKVLYKKELEEHELEQKLKTIEGHRLFLNNCIRKMSDNRFRRCNLRYLRNLKDLLYIIENKKLRKENVAKCEQVLKLLNSKIEQNTIKAIKLRAEKKYNNLTIDYTVPMVNISETTDILNKLDPRTTIGKLKYNKSQEKMELTIIHFPLSAKEEERKRRSESLGLKFKIKPKTPTIDKLATSKLLMTPNTPTNFATSAETSLSNSFWQTNYFPASSTNADPRPKITNTDPRLTNRSLLFGRLPENNTEPTLYSSSTAYQNLSINNDFAVSNQITIQTPIINDYNHCVSGYSAARMPNQNLYSNESMQVHPILYNPNIENQYNQPLFERRPANNYQNVDNQYINKEIANSLLENVPRVESDHIRKEDNFRYNSNKSHTSSEKRYDGHSSQRPESTRRDRNIDRDLSKLASTSRKDDEELWSEDELEKTKHKSLETDSKSNLDHKKGSAMKTQETRTKIESKLEHKSDTKAKPKSATTNMIHSSKQRYVDAPSLFENKFKDIQEQQKKEPRPPSNKKRSPVPQLPSDKSKSLKNNEKSNSSKVKKSEKPEAKRRKIDKEEDPDKLLEKLSEIYGKDKIQQIKKVLTSPEEPKTSSTSKAKNRDNTKSEPIGEVKKSNKRELASPKQQKISLPSTLKSTSVLNEKEEDKKMADTSIKIESKDSDNEIVPDLVPVPKKKNKNEIDKLYEDINKSFIRNDMFNLREKRQAVTNQKSYSESILRIENSLESPTKAQKKLTHQAAKVIKNSDATVPKLTDNKVNVVPHDPVDSSKLIKRCFVKLERCDINSVLASLKQEKAICRRNTDCSVNLFSKTLEQCRVCLKFANDIIAHYVEVHSDRELFPSRLCEDIAKTVLAEPFKKEGKLCSKKYTAASKITQTCKFCLQTLNLNPRKWKFHIISHTGEFYCKGCNVRCAHPQDSKAYFSKIKHEVNCDNRKFSIDDITFEHGCLNAFMCTLCNFIQLKKENVEKHLYREHEQKFIAFTDILRFEIVNYKLASTSPTIELPNLVRQTNEVVPSANATDHNYSIATMVIKKEKVEPIEPQFSIPIEIKPTSLSFSSQKGHKDANKIVNQYSSRSNMNNILKTWSSQPSNKQGPFASNMLSLECLFSLYKCMNEYCCFATSVENEALQHFNIHASDKNECCYCDNIFSNSIDLIQHINTVHGNSIYCCSMCFYRSINSYNVIVHQKHYHSGYPPKVLICEDLFPSPTNDLEMINKNKSKYIPPLLCTICGLKIFAIESFKNHLAMHADKEQIKCQGCRESFTREELLKHMQNHRIGLFECVYCFYGTNELPSIRLHMSTIHPTKPLFVVARKSRESIDNVIIDYSSIESTVLVNISGTVDEKLYFKYEEFVNFSSGPSQPLLKKEIM